MREKMQYLALIAAIFCAVASSPSDLKAASPGISVRILADVNGRPLNIDAMSFTEGITGPPERKSGVANQNRQSSFALQFSRVLDGSSANLRAMAAAGTRLPSVTIDVTLPGNPSKPILRLTIEQVIISSVSMASPVSTGISLSSYSGAIETCTLAVDPDSSVLTWESWVYNDQGVSIHSDVYKYILKNFK